MITIGQIILGSLVGTSLMTLFSYLMTYEVKEQFKEPLLLNKLLNRSKVIKMEDARSAGWFIHYGMGTAFTIAYHFIWQVTAINPSLLSGGLLGFVSGFVGVAGWSFIFNIHSSPPHIEFSDYYMHLIVAHIIFGIGATVGYELASNNLALY